MNNLCPSYWETASNISKQSFPTSEPPRSVDVLIVGAGFAGSWLAHHLIRKHPKLQIAVIERDQLSLGSSTRNAGFLSCGNISEWLEDSRELGWEETIRTFQARMDGIEIIRSELGDRLSSARFGSVDIDEVTPEKIQLMQRFNEYLENAGRPAFFEQRTIAFGGSERPAFINHFDSEVNPCDVLLHLHATLLRAGVTFVRNTVVQNAAAGRAELIASDGSLASLAYGHAFICVNAFSKNLYAGSDVEPARGQILVTAPCRTSTHKSLGFIKSGYDYYRFIGDRLLVGGGRLNFKAAESTDAIETSVDLRRYLTDLAKQIIGHDDFVIDHHWSGIMGLRKGRHASITDFSKLTPVDAKTEEINTCGGWGVTLSPIVMRIRAERWS